MTMADYDEVLSLLRASPGAANGKRPAHSKVVEMVLKGKKPKDATASERQAVAIGS